MVETKRTDSPMCVARLSQFYCSHARFITGSNGSGWDWDHPTALTPSANFLSKVQAKMTTCNAGMCKCVSHPLRHRLPIHYTLGGEQRADRGQTIFPCYLYHKVIFQQLPVRRQVQHRAGRQELFSPCRVVRENASLDLIHWCM